MNETKSNNQYSKLISIELSGMKYTYWHFEDLEYLNTINNQYSEILSNVTERGPWKLFTSELMDVRFGRSAFNHFQSFHYYFALSTNRNHHPPSFSPILQYPISQYTHCFLLTPFITIQTFINGWIIDCQIGTVWFFVFIDSICFLDKKYGYRLW